MAKKPGAGPSWADLKEAALQTDAATTKARTEMVREKNLTGLALLGMLVGGVSLAYLRSKQAEETLDVPWECQHEMETSQYLTEVLAAFESIRLAMHGVRD